MDSFERVIFPLLLNSHYRIDLADLSRLFFRTLSLRIAMRKVRVISRCEQGCSILRRARNARCETDGNDLRHSEPAGIGQSTSCPPEHPRGAIAFPDGRQDLRRARQARDYD